MTLDVLLRSSTYMTVSHRCIVVSMSANATAG